MRSTTNINIIKYLPLILGPLLFLLITYSGIIHLNNSVLKVIGITAWMLTWWITEIIPVPATALLPLVLFPFFGILDMNATALNYANPTIFLYMAGFIMALAMEKHGLHSRIALHIVRFVGTKTNKLILGFMIATAFLSMWVNNTAAALLMLPIATSVLQLMKEEFYAKGYEDEFRKFAISVLLGVAYCSSIGGIATIIGTPTNTVMLGYFKQSYNIDISFAGWFVIGFPMAVLMLVAAYYIIVKMLFRAPVKSLPDAALIVEEKIKALGAASFAEYAVTIVFLLTAAGWIFRAMIAKWLAMPFLNDTIIGMTGALLLFIIPDSKSKTFFLFDWSGMNKLSWGILLLIGGGLTLAKAMENSGVVKLVGDSIAASPLQSYFLLLVTVVAVTLLLKQFIGNTALASIALPMAMGIAHAKNINPVLLGGPVTFACSFAFMLPMSTPPNALVFTTGWVKMKDMLKAGVLLSIAGFLLLLAASKVYHFMV